MACPWWLAHGDALPQRDHPIPNTIVLVTRMIEMAAPDAVNRAENAWRLSAAMNAARQTHRSGRRHLNNMGFEGGDGNVDHSEAIPSLFFYQAPESSGVSLINDVPCMDSTDQVQMVEDAHNSIWLGDSKHKLHSSECETFLKIELSQPLVHIHDLWCGSCAWRFSFGYGSVVWWVVKFLSLNWSSSLIIVLQ